VAGVIVDYIAALPPEAWEALPAECVSVLKSSVDVQTAALWLVQAELTFEGPPEAAAIVHEVAHTFAVAAVRLTSLYGAPPPAG
jgi:hypothetical protein